MPSVRWRVTCPKGTFATVKQAAEAMHCDRATFMARLLRGEPGYKRERIVAKKKPVPDSQPVLPGVRWPISWYQYRFQTDAVKEEIYQAWCLHHSRDPEAEDTAWCFFDEMDQVVIPEDQDDTDDQFV